MATETVDSGSLLRGPSDEEYASIERQPSVYKPFHTFALPSEKHYQQQYADLYFLRLTLLKPVVEKIAAEAWDGFLVGNEEAKKVERVLDVRQGELCWVTGTVYMDMPLKPNILEDISKDHWISAPPPRQKYLSQAGEDLTMIEDESGRLRLIGSPLSNEMLVTGCIIAVMGTENANGDFEVVDIKVPELPPQDERWTHSKPATSNGSLKVEERKSKRPRLSELDEDAVMEGTEQAPNATTTSSKIAIVSGLGFSGSSADHALQINLLTEFLLGEALTPSMQQAASQINRLIIAGNSITGDNDAVSHDTIGNTRKATAQKKYGYDSSAYNPAPTAHLDAFLADLLPSLPVTLMPGASDPANASLPQQGIHAAMFPHARAYAAEKGGEAEPGWFDAVTNPWEGEVDGWRLLGTGGQNVDDVFKYVESEDRLGMLEAICRWRCVAPTAPDTIWSYPFQDTDPYVLTSCPHVFFVGSQPRFDTAMIEGADGQVVRLIAVPKFAETGEVVLVDTETLAVEVVKIGVFDPSLEAE